MTVELKELPFETDAGFGSRARIGLVVLENDQTVEAELATLWPEGWPLSPPGSPWGTG